MLLSIKGSLKLRKILIFTSDFKIISNSKHFIFRNSVKLFEKEINKEEMISKLLNRKNLGVIAIQYDTLRWPDRLNIKIKEHQPLAYLEK